MFAGVERQINDLKTVQTREWKRVAALERMKARLSRSNKALSRKRNALKDEENKV